MSDTPQGADWWLGDDGKWYPPDRWTGPPGTTPPINTVYRGPATSATAVPQATTPTIGRMTMRPKVAWYRSLPAMLLGGALIFGAGFVARGLGDQTPTAQSVEVQGETTTSLDCPDGTLTSDSGCKPIGAAKRTTTTMRPTTTTAAPTTTAAHYVPTVADFQIGIIEVERSCFGSAGCNVTYRIDPKYLGPPLGLLDKYTVVYEVHGGEDMQTKNFDIEAGEASYSEELIQTPPGGALTAVPVRVLAG